MILQRGKQFGLKSDGKLGYLDDPFADLYLGGDDLPPKPEWVEPFFCLLNGRYDSNSWRKPLTANLTKVDWFRCSFNGDSSLWLLPDIMDELATLLPDAVFTSSPKRMMGYTDVTAISIWQDNQLIQIGWVGVELAFSSSHCGVCVDLSGVGCTLAQKNLGLWQDWIYFVAGWRGRLTRVDLALDLMPEYCKARAITVPWLASEAVKNDMFTSERLINKKNMTYNCVGDWTPLMMGQITLGEYNPENHSPKGLTFNIGARTSPIYWRCYEKGKQLLGQLKQTDASIDRNWVRLECEFKRDKDGANIPYELLIESDYWFVKDRPLLQDFLNAYREFLSENPIYCFAFIDFAKKEKELKLSKKIAWARRQYGRLVKTLNTIGFTNDEICTNLLGDKGLKDYIYDLQ